ncbi:hypothetical protein IGI04_040045 [Brassica rapa subsp. trilocularis]|uniref:Uncharacterized protein n=1 Tax=Brassica rapa subsp. trilocularis TaxID=1813537 RepID=A0ABQ7KQ99_BRACM|nr:hypothetical protein IGI04_040045 [Brassica rapa subsp. trilocularis]
MGRTEAFIRFRDDVTKVEKAKHFLAKPIPRESASEPRLTRSAGLGPLFDGLCGWVKSIPNSKSPPSSLMVEQSIFDEFGVFSSENKSWSSESCYVPRGLEGECSDCCVAEARSLGGFFSGENQRSVERIASQHWISDSLPHINRSTLKRLSLFTRAEQKEINRARTMKQLPDLSLITAGKIGAKKGTDDSAGVGITDAAPVTAERAPTGGSSQGKNSKKKKSKETRKESNEMDQTDLDNPSKKGGKKRKAVEPPAEDVPRKKKTKKQDFSVPRPSSVCEEELQVLVPDATPEVGTSDDDENETIALRRRRREGPQQNRGASVGGQGISEVPRELPASERQQVPLRGDSSAHITEGSETRVSGRPKETPEDGFKFEFNRELPLACYPEDCARLLRLVKGGPDQLPSVGDLIFKDEYEHASCSSSHGDWNVLVGKYDTALRRAREQNRESEEAKKKAEEALRVSSREKTEAIARERSLRKAFDETRTSDAAELQMCKEAMNNLEVVVDKQQKEKVDLERRMDAESLRHSEEMTRLRKSRRYEPAQTAVSSNQHTDQGVDPAERTSVGAVIQKDGAVPTIVLTDSSAKASKNASSSASSSEDPGKEDELPTETPAANVTDSIPTKFGRVSGPGEGDGSGDKDPPVVD